MLKKIFSFVLLSLLFCVPCEAVNNPDHDIYVIYTNDVHCKIEGDIGYAGVEYFKNEAKKITPYVTLVDAGDWSQGEPIGTISNGRYLFEIMNALNYDFAVPGNHEFDYGWSQFENFVKNLKCGLYSCNIKDLRTGELVLKPYKIFEYGNVKVAFVGATTPDSIVKANQSIFMDENRNYIYDIDVDKTGEKICASIQKAVDDARNEGADFVILVGHLGEYDDVTTEWSAPYIAERTRNIDVFIDGHSHEVTPAMKVKNLDGKEINITQTGKKLKNIGLLKIKTNGEITTELVNHVETKDEKINALIQDIKKRFEETLTIKLTYTSFDLIAIDDNGKRLVRYEETNISDFVSDAFLASAAESNFGKADIAFINGGIKTNIKAGDVTLNDSLSVLPYGNTMCIIEISGQTILDELENGARVMRDDYGGFLHVSHNVTYTVDLKIPSPVQTDDRKKMTGISGERRIKDVMINGEPLDPERKYIVVSTNYILLEGGDGHLFEGSKIIERDYMVDADAFSHYLKSFAFIPERYKEPQGRITIIK